jgi:hypothetical protein
VFYVPEDGIFNSHRRENLKSFLSKVVAALYYENYSLASCNYSFKLNKQDSVREGFLQCSHNKKLLTSIRNSDYVDFSA